MESGSIQKYMLYAVGEILLVMIGILLALQVNNWNEQRKEQFEEKKILKEIAESFKSDVDGLKNMILRLKKADADLYDILYHVDHNIPYYDSLNYKFRWLTQPHRWRFNRTAFRSLENTGLDIIRDSNIKEMIIYAYEGFYPRLNRSFQNYEDNILQYSRPLIRKHFHIPTTASEDYDSMLSFKPIDFEMLRGMPEFRNILITLKYSSKFELDQVEAAVIGIPELIELIEDYVD